MCQDIFVHLMVNSFATITEIPYKRRIWSASLPSIRQTRRIDSPENYMIKTLGLQVVDYRFA